MKNTDYCCFMQMLQCEMYNVREISATQLNSWSVESRKIFLFLMKKHAPDFSMHSVLCMYVSPHCCTFDDLHQIKCIEKQCFNLLKSICSSPDILREVRNNFELWNTKHIDTKMNEIQWLFVIQRNIGGTPCLCAVES